MQRRASWPPRPGHNDGPGGCVLTCQGLIPAWHHCWRAAFRSSTSKPFTQRLPHPSLTHAATFLLDRTCSRLARDSRCEEGANAAGCDAAFSSDPCEFLWIGNDMNGSNMLCLHVNGQ